MAKIERPAPEDKMAVLETSELPGRASRRDWAFLAGSSAGTLDEEALRVVSAVERAGRVVRTGRFGRSRTAPTISF